MKRNKINEKKKKKKQVFLKSCKTVTHRRLFFVYLSISPFFLSFYNFFFLVEFSCVPVYFIKGTGAYNVSCDDRFSFLQ